MPTRFISASARTSPASYSSGVGGGTRRLTRAVADSRSSPVGSPRASRSIRPASGSFVARVMPAAARAAEFTQSEWPVGRAQGRRAVAGDGDRDPPCAAAPAETQGAPSPRRPARCGTTWASAQARMARQRGFGGLEIVQVALPQLHAGADGMHVRVVERGHHEPPAKIDEARAGARQPSDVGAGANGDDAALPDGQGLGRLRWRPACRWPRPRRMRSGAGPGGRRVRAANRENQSGSRAGRMRG